MSPLSLFEKSPCISSLIKKSISRISNVNIANLQGSALAFFICSVIKNAEQPFLIISPNFDSFLCFREEFTSIMQQENLDSKFALYEFPDYEIQDMESKIAFDETRKKRLRVLFEIHNSQSAARIPIIFSTLDAVLRYTVSKENYIKLLWNIKKHVRVNMEEIISHLRKLGYRRVETTQIIGDYSIRGSIVDFFSSHTDMPIRLDFWGDIVDDIRTFSPDSQMSLESLESVFISPVYEIADYELKNLKSAEELKAKEMKLNLQSGHPPKWVSHNPQSAIANIIFSPQDYGADNSLIDAFPNKNIFSIDLPSALKSFNNKIQQMSAQVIKTEAQRHKGTEELSIVDCRLSIENLNNQQLTTNNHLQSTKHRGQNTDSVGSRQSADRDAQFGSLYNRKLPNYQITKLPNHRSTSAVSHQTPDTRPIYSILNINENSKFLILFSHSIIETEVSNGFSFAREDFVNPPIKLIPPLPLDLTSIAKILKEKSIENNVIIFSKYKKRLDHFLCDEDINNVLTYEGNIESGFLIEDIPLYVFSDTEIFKQLPHHRLPKRTSEDAQREKPERIPIFSLSDISVGDYVVHIDHGIGIYEGITTEISGYEVKKDFFSIRYTNNDRLFVPIEQISRVEKYIGSEGNIPKIYPLDSSKWGNVKKKVKKKAEDIAAVLFKLYQEREQAKREPFLQDDFLQQELEASFPFDETEDQIKSIADIKRDMENKKPMDRLIYADVGFGKTEVAIRAAFKACLSKKQVAMLTPTTILALQHGETFKTRLARFPITCEVLSRFKTKKEQKEIVKKLAAGETDIVIGTHRLVQKDISFHNLGLVIIDEEQRFGVKHKEALKLLKTNVDVLTLTATPIPRTLNMSLVGLRDMSVIETPPEERKAVKTFVEEWNAEKIRFAVKKEIDREGQIYFVHNDIQSIPDVERFLLTMLPNLRIGTCHGQMPETQVENTMVKFLARDYDLLLCTTIIENGLDIPTVNTLIVDAAENFGLAQLYQLRGRVGRSYRQAYAYMFYSPYKSLGENAKKRLDAIKDFAELGSGYRLALKDLEIRGAGNLLGKEQHGYITEVGFSLYCQMLSEAVGTLKGVKIKELPQVDIDVLLDTFIPENYIKEISSRTNIYKQLLAAISVGEIEKIKENVVDVYGALPVQIENLFLVAEFKIYASKLGIKKVKTHPNGLFTDIFLGQNLGVEFFREMPYPIDFEGEISFFSERIRIKHAESNMISEVKSLLSFLKLSESYL